MTDARTMDGGSLGGGTADTAGLPPSSLRTLVAELVELGAMHVESLQLAAADIDRAVQALGGDDNAYLTTGSCDRDVDERMARSTFIHDAAWALTDAAESAAGSARGRSELLEAAGEHDSAVGARLEAAQLAEDSGDCAAARADIDVILASRPSAAAPERSLLLEQRARLAAEAAHEDAEECWRQAARAYEAVGDDEGRARSLYQASWAAETADGAATLLQAASAIGVETIGWAARAAALAAIDASRYLDSLELDEGALRIARRNGDRHLEALAMLGIAVARSLSGDLTAAIEAQRSAISLARVAGNRRAEDSGRFNLVSMLHDDLRDEEAEAEAALLTAIQRDRGRWGAAAEAQVMLGLVRASRGQLAAATADVDSARRRAQDSACDPACRSIVLGIAARVHASAGSSMELVLEPLLLELSDSATLERSTWLGTASLQAQSMLLEDLGDFTAAGELLLRIEPGENGVTAAEVACALARVAIATGETRLIDRAEELLGGATVQARMVSGARRQVACVREALELEDPARCTRSADEWIRRGRMLEGARLLLAASERAARDVAVQLAARAQTLLAAGGAEQARARAARRAEQLLATGEGNGTLEPLMSLPLFAGMEPAVRDELLAHAITVRRDRGAILHEPGDEIQHLSIVRSGRVRLCRITGDDRRLTVELLDAGSPFGEHRLLGLRTSGTIAEAEEDVVLALLPIDRVVAAISRSSHLGQAIFALVGGRLERSRQLAERVAFWSVDRRLARCILELDERYGHPTLDGHRIVSRAFTHFQLAELVNARRETVGEFLKRLREAGIIELRRRCIVVLDPSALERIVSET